MLGGNGFPDVRHQLGTHRENRWFGGRKAEIGKGVAAALNDSFFVYGSISNPPIPSQAANNSGARVTFGAGFCSTTHKS